MGMRSSLLRIFYGFKLVAFWFSVTRIQRSILVQQLRTDRLDLTCARVRWCSCAVGLTNVRLMQRLILVTIFVALQIICPGCQTQSGKLRAVNPSDGVSRSEARIIARCYSEKHLGGGKITGVSDGGDHWIVVGKLGGYLAKPLSFDIDKHSGKITSRVGPSYDCPLDIYR